MNKPLLMIVLPLLLSVGPAMAAQPHMEQALKDLQQARQSLEQASADKGGHRQRSLAAVDKAIAEVKRGIAFDAAHPADAGSGK